ncbi:MAG: 16S rRNA (guanine(966)-N(2))-methyltransferase RsmD [Pseudomonadota bacterium]
MKQRKIASTGVRIIGGERRGKKLLSVHGLATRPTANRVRESIYNIISARVPEAMVLDLFAGTGIMGIEALSRGACFALFIDNCTAPIETIQKNLISCRFETRAKVIQQDIQKGLRWLKTVGPLFNLAFLDPPYQKALIGSTLSLLHDSGALSPNALIVVEHSIAEPLSGILSAFKQIDQRNYGKTLVSFIHYII